MGFRVRANAAESAAIALNNGCHLNCGSAYTNLVTASAMELVDEETVTEAAEKLFEAHMSVR